MSELSIHESSFLKSFIRSDKRSRYQQFLADPKRRSKILDRLNHNLDLNWSLATRIPSSHRGVDELEQLVRLRGAGPKCFLISDDQEIDGEEMRLREALEEVRMIDGGTVISCIPGSLALYREESPGDWFLLELKTR